MPSRLSPTSPSSSLHINKQSIFAHPLPDTRQRLPTSESPPSSSSSLAKKTAPKPVASGRRREPPHSSLQGGEIQMCVQPSWLGRGIVFGCSHVKKPRPSSAACTGTMARGGGLRSPLAGQHAGVSAHDALVLPKQVANLSCACVAAGSVRCSTSELTQFRSRSSTPHDAADRVLTQHTTC